MPDKLTNARRSANMARIRSKDTKPELLVRRLLHRFGYRFRVHDRRLPGKPDLVFQRRKKVVFVHGCFWHQHPLDACLDSRPPKSNVSYWGPKLERNVVRDRDHIIALQAAGWQVLVIWECETKSIEHLETRIRAYLGVPRVS